MNNILNFIKQASVKIYINIKKVFQNLNTKIKILCSKISAGFKWTYQSIIINTKSLHSKLNNSKTKAQFVILKDKIVAKTQAKHTKKILVTSLLLISASALVIISVFTTRSILLQNSNDISSKEQKSNISIETPKLISIEDGAKYEFVSSYKNYEYDIKNLPKIKVEIIDSNNEVFYSEIGIIDPKTKTIIFKLDNLPKLKLDKLFTNSNYTLRLIKNLEARKDIADSSLTNNIILGPIFTLDFSKSFASLYEKNYVLMNLSIENIFKIPTYALLKKVIKENYLPEQKEKIIEQLLDLVNKNYKSVLESNDINLGDKELVIKLSDKKEHQDFYESDIYYFILNNKTIQQQNQTNDPEAILLSNKDKSIQFTITKDPFISANKLGKAIQNNKFDIKRLSSETLFGHKEDGANTYRIPGIIKLKNGTLIANADKRYQNFRDYFNNITQAIKFSYDNGRTWTNPREILKVQIPSLKNQGLTIDGTMIEVEYFENVSNKKGTKLLFFVDIFPDKTGLPHLHNGTIWTKINGKNYLRLYTRLKSNDKFDDEISFLERVPGTQNWFRRVILKDGKDIKNATSSDFTLTSDYVDLNYHTETSAITGIVYKNIESESELNNPEVLQSKKTEYSVLDFANNNKSKYVLSSDEYVNKKGEKQRAFNNHVVSIESYDNGKTWKNLRWIDEDVYESSKNAKFSGTAVGNPIQLKHQKDPKLNGRILLPMYQIGGGGLPAYYLYSDDYGNSWKRQDVSFPRNLTESSMIEAKDGSIYWLLRNDRGFGAATAKHWITKSVDGGKTWINPNGDTGSNGKDLNIGNKNFDGNVFSGIGYFNLKGKDYFIFSIAKDNIRRNGSLFITDSTFNDATELFDYDFMLNQGNKNEHFVYSYALTIDEEKDYVDILSIYEASEKTRVHGDSHGKGLSEWEKHRPQADEIQVDRFRIWLKDQK
ncbi:exo-alpha-sialidase [Mycoplasmopsis cynos]|uniref:exo-alpha-sialidase n=1 Tax=Mycoplasmopsis cynos TaxID=171284 RepID=A0A449AIC5_9BACT|nr:sialidase family protein [Mycoplasmopsis cynos]VEU64719.1 Sialidase A precursor [Mycoplasmopsis cynos]